MSSRMPITNYKILKERMIEKNKGFWKVQSIHKLETKLSTKFNTQDYILMKYFQRTQKDIPSFISFSNINKKIGVKEKRSVKIQTNLESNRNIFLTNENKDQANDKKNKKEIKKKLYLSLYKNFPYEPYLYNELQFIYLKGSNKLIPRKFNEVVKDCFIMDKYNKYLLNKKKSIYKLSYSNSTNKNMRTQSIYNDINIVNDDKAINTISIEGRSNKLRIKRNINKKLGIEKDSEINTINTNYSNTMYDGFFKNRKRRINNLQFLGDKHLTDRDEF
jgi:hypothetical protein